MRSVLYISYDGLTDSLGQSQILAYLKRLNTNSRIVILSYEKAELFDKEGQAVQKIIDESNLIWCTLPYTKKPPILATIKDIHKGIQKAKQLHRQFQFDIVHCRGYIPAIIGRKLKQSFGIKFIFDMRGWWADEKKESGFWDKKLYQPVYNYFKILEKKFFNDADFVVSLTHKGKEEIVKQNLAREQKIGVIPTCVDFEIFRPGDEAFKQQMKDKLGIKRNEKVFVYSGSLGGNYDPAILAKVFKAYKAVYPETYLLILSKDRSDSKLQQFFLNAEISRVALYNVPFSEVSGYLRASDIGFIYYKISFSVIGRSPTKMGEYWASGIPVIAFKGIGDLDHILEHYPGSGLLLSPDESTWEIAMRNWQAVTPTMLREYAVDYFHVDKGVNFYQAVYENLISIPSPSALPE